MKNEDRKISEFWNWFEIYQHEFSIAIAADSNVEVDVVNKLASKLSELKHGIYPLVGMFDEDTAELIVCAHGNINNIYLIEDLIASSPKVDGWRFTALKSEMSIEDVSIRMSGYLFDKNNLRFYPDEDPIYPDEIDLVIVYDNYQEPDKSIINSAVNIFLDNYLGELDFLTNIDYLRIKSPEDSNKELISISKLKDYLRWREKEFVEKYKDSVYDSTDDQFALFESQNKEQLSYRCRNEH